MKRKIPALLAALLMLCSSLFAQRKITIKMASPVPENSPWGECLNRIAGEWRRITGGEVELLIYHNGVAGGEDAVVRNLRVNQIQAAVLSTFGMYELSHEIMTLSCPFLIRNDDELDAVLTGLKPELEATINAKGFYTLAWARVGWVKVFSKAPVFTPADLKRQKLGTNGEQAELNQAFKSMGFQMIPVARNDILVALNGGMVDAVYESPIAVGSLQIFGLAKNMASINIAPFMGGIIFNQRAWRSIPDKYKNDLIAATRKIEAELDRSVRALESDMVKTMGSYGLKVNQLSSGQEQLWYDEIGKVMPSLIGTVFDRNIYNRITAILTDYRSRQR
jgi:TRAP-type C4-dicarboxylate transport system substrate-binding protein